LKCLILLTGISLSQLLCANEVGQVQYTYGAVIMQNMDGSGARLIAKETLLQRGDVVKTGPRSFTMVKLNDGTRMTIRPNSSFLVERFNPEKDSSARAVLRLFRGGMRVISGYISTGHSDGYKVKTDAATLGVHDAVFDVRICRDDCDDESKKLEQRKKAHDKTIADVVAPGLYVSITKGRIKLTNKDGLSLDLKAGQSVYTDVLGRQNRYLSSIPVFQQFDIYPVPDASGSAVISFNVRAINSEDSGIVCEIE
jgi:hypothetical protein